MNPILIDFIDKFTFKQLKKIFGIYMNYKKKEMISINIQNIYNNYFI